MTASYFVYDQSHTEIMQDQAETCSSFPYSFGTNYLGEEPSSEQTGDMHLTTFINPRPSLFIET